MYNILFFVLMILFVVYISKNNYKNRASTINSNILEFGDEILKTYYNLSEYEQNKFKDCLNPKETVVFKSLLENSYRNISSINSIQSSMFIMEDLMRKLKSQSN